MNDTYPKRCSTSVRKTQIEIVMRPYVHLMEKKKRLLSLCHSPVLKLSHTPVTCLMDHTLTSPLSSFASSHQTCLLV